MPTATSGAATSAHSATKRTDRDARNAMTATRQDAPPTGGASQRRRRRQRQEHEEPRVVPAVGVAELVDDARRAEAGVPQEIARQPRPAGVANVAASDSARTSASRRHGSATPSSRAPIANSTDTRPQKKTPA